jgi:hypothetical protein
LRPHRQSRFHPKPLSNDHLSAGQNLHPLDGRYLRERNLRLVVATDAVCEGLNLQTLGTLINIDLPWNPSRLEQRFGRIKRFGQRRERVDMLNLVYHGTVEEKVYATLSKRMKDRYDILGSLPDVIDDDWIEDIEALEKHLSPVHRTEAPSECFRPAIWGHRPAGRPWLGVVRKGTGPPGCCRATIEGMVMEWLGRSCVTWCLHKPTYENFIVGRRDDQSGLSPCLSDGRLKQ